MSDTPWKYTLSEMDMPKEDLEAVADCIRSEWLSMGPRTQKFENTFAEMCNVKHAIAVSNGTAALHLSMAGLGIGEGDEVIQPSINFVASANMTRALGAKPVFADSRSLLDPTVSVEDINAKITDKTKAVVVMHFGGYACQMDDIKTLCDERGLQLIEDACHAPCQKYTGELGGYLGTIGEVGCFSFFSNKNMTTAEGGMVVTNNDELADALRKMRSHGMTTLSWDRHHGRPSTYDVMMHGFNYRMDDMRAALGVSQLSRLLKNNDRRRDRMAVYAEEVAKLNSNEINFIFGDRPKDGTGHVAGVVIPEEKRDAVRLALAEKRIQTSLHYPPIHKFTAFSDFADTSLPVAEQFSRSMITLPMHAYLPEAAPAEIIATLYESLQSTEAKAA